MLNSIVEWCYGLPISEAYRNSLYLFALTQALHVLAITAFVGAIAIGDLRLLGWGLVHQSRAVVVQGSQRVLLWAGLVVLLTGIPQFMTNALDYARSPLFIFKMYLLAAAVVFTITLRQRVAMADPVRLPSWLPKVVGATSLALWMGVTISGRLINYYG